MTTEDLALEKVQRTMELVEEAQRSLGEAAAELSNIIGGAVEWNRLSKLYDQVHAAWYRLERLQQRGRIDLDGIAKARLAAADTGVGPSQ